MIATNFLAYHIYVPPWDLIGPPAPLFRAAPFNQMQIGPSKQLAVPTSDGGAFSGVARSGYQAFKLTDSVGEGKADVFASITNALGDAALQVLEADQLLVPTNIAVEPAGSYSALESQSLPLLKCHRARRTDNEATSRKTRSITVTDALKRTWTVEVGEPAALCRPLDRRGRDLMDHPFSLVGYQIKDANSAARPSEQSRLSAANEFGTRVLQVEQPELLFVPSLVE